MSSSALKPAAELAKAGGIRFPNESAEYRRAREALLAEEIELRRHIERVAEQRRALPPGGEVSEELRVRGRERASVVSPTCSATRIRSSIYNYMFGPQRERPCPMCTSLLSAWDGEAPRHRQRVALAVVARSPIERLVAFKRERGWHNLPLYPDIIGRVQPRLSCADRDGGEMPAFNVFTRRDGTIRHFWGGEMGGATADPGQDPRGAPDLMPLWTILDMTPEGRGTDWYPKLNY